MAGDVIDAKAALRSGIRERRRGRQDRADAEPGLARGIHEVLGSPAAPVAVYLAMPTEPPTAVLVRDFGPVLVPRTSTSSTGEPTLEWVEFKSGDAVSTSSMGMDEPTGPAVGTGVQPLLTCSAVVIPSLAVDGQGRRLGQGGGYYDRVLAMLSARTPIITLVFDDEVIDDVYAESHDVRVDVCVTPTRILRFNR